MWREKKEQFSGRNGDWSEPVRPILRALSADRNRPPFRKCVHRLAVDRLEFISSLSVEQNRRPQVERRNLRAPAKHRTKARLTLAPQIELTCRVTRSSSSLRRDDCHRETSSSLLGYCTVLGHVTRLPTPPFVPFHVRAAWLHLIQLNTIRSIGLG